MTAQTAIVADIGGTNTRVALADVRWCARAASGGFPTQTS